MQEKSFGAREKLGTREEINPEEQRGGRSGAEGSPQGEGQPGVDEGHFNFAVAGMVEPLSAKK